MVLRGDRQRQHQHQRRHQRPRQPRPGQRPAQQRRQRGGHQREAAVVQRVEARAQVHFDLAHAEQAPPAQAAEYQQHLQHGGFAGAVVEPARGHPGQRQQAQVHGVAVEQEAVFQAQVPVEQAHAPGAAGQHQQGQAAPAHQAALLAQAQPHHARALDRPGCGRPSRRQRQRNGQRGEHHAHAGGALRQVAQALVAARPQRQSAVNGRNEQRAEGQAHAVVAQQAHLHREGQQRRAEQQRAVHFAVLAAARQRVQHRDGRVEQEEQHQEGFNRGELFRLVVLRAPHPADGEGEHETHQVQRPPRPLPGNAEHGGVEHRVIREQRHVVAAARRKQHRRQVAADEAQHGQRGRVLLHRQHAGTGHQDEHHHEGRHGAQHFVIAEGREHHQQQDADGAALQAQAEGRALGGAAQAPDQARDGAGGDAGQAEFDGHGQPAGVGGVLDGRGHAEQEHQHAQLHRHVAFEEPGLEQAGGLGDDVGFGRFGRLRGRAGRGGRRRCGGNRRRHGAGRGGGRGGGRRRGRGRGGRLGAGRRRGGLRQWAGSRRFRGHGANAGHAHRRHLLFQLGHPAAQLQGLGQQYPQQGAGEEPEQHAAVVGQHGSEQCAQNPQDPAHAFAHVP